MFTLSLFSLLRAGCSRGQTTLPSCSLFSRSFFPVFHDPKLCAGGDGERCLSRTRDLAQANVCTDSGCVTVSNVHHSAV